MTEKKAIRYKNKIPCDYNKLKRAVENRGLTLGEASLEMGYAGSMLCNSKIGEAITAPLAKLLEMCFNIKPDEYAPDPVPDQIAFDDLVMRYPKPEPNNIDYRDVFKSIEEDLYKIMYKAVYDAVKQAWSE